MTHAAQFALAHGTALLFTWILLQQAGVPIPSAPLLIAAGSLASSRGLGLPSSLVKGPRFCRANSNWKNRVLSLIWRHSAATLLLAKFIAGSNVASLLAGQAGISAARFVIYDSIGSLTWSGSYIALGYLLHGQLHWTLAQTLRPLFIVRVAVSLARLWRRGSLAHAVLAPAIVFFAVRPVSQHNADMRMSADVMAEMYDLQAQAISHVDVYWVLAVTSGLMFLVASLLARNEQEQVAKFQCIEGDHAKETQIRVENRRSNMHGEGR